MSDPVIPAKRPSPSSIAGDATPAPNKIPRTDNATPSNAPATTPGGLNGTARRPKTAALLDKTREHEPAEVRGVELETVEQQFEVEDAAGYAETLLIIQTLFSRLHYPTRTQIRLLLTLTLFPLLFTPPKKSSNPAFKRAGNSSTTQSAATEALSRSALQPHSDEPLVLSHKKLRAQALAVLQDVVSTSGVEVVCRAIRGSEVPETAQETAARLVKEEARRKEREAQRKKDEDEEKAAASAPSNGRKVKVTRQKHKQPAEDDSEAEDFGPGEMDEPILTASKRIGQAEDLWDFLAGTTAKKARLRTREKPVAEGGGWPVLGVFVKGWEEEHRKKEQAKESQEPIHPLSLLRYFKPSASVGVAREISSKALDVVFWPFSTAAAPKTKVQSSSSDDGLSELDGSEGKEDGAGEGDDGMDLQAKREVAVRLLGVIGASAIDGWLNGAALLAEAVQRMKTLEHPDFLSFIELLSLTPLNSSFTARLLTTYLETHSHPLTHTPNLVPSLPSSALSSSTVTSPRKRLGHNGSLASLASDADSLPETLSSSLSSSAATSFWRIPALSSPDFLAFAARIPMEVPIVLPPPAAGERRPKLNLPSSFARAAAANESHRVVKAALVGLLSEKERLEEKTRREVAEVLKKVQELVEDARKRVEER